MTSIRSLVCWGFCWLALIGATPAFGQVQDISPCFPPRALDISAVVGAAPTQHVFFVDEGATFSPDDDCGIEETFPFDLSVTFLNGTGWLSVPSSGTFAPGQVNSFTITINYAALPMAGVFQALIILTLTDSETGELFRQPFRSRSH